MITSRIMDKNDMNLESNSDDKCKVISELLLPEDLVIDILSRVSLKTLLSSARYVCKSWYAIISSSSFAQLCLQCSKPGLIVENMLDETYYFLDIKDDLSGHYERIDLVTNPGMGRLRSTCHGLLLFWKVSERIFVVNPILKCCLRVPPIPTPQSLTIDSITIARVPRSNIFKLFFVDTRKVSGVYWIVFYVLKIGIDNSWKEIAARKNVHHVKYFVKYFMRTPVYSGGNDLYWIMNEEVILIDVDKEVIVGEYPLPPLWGYLYPRAKFLWMENCLSCIVHEHSTRAFQIYILDINSGKWSLYHEMVLFDHVLASGLEVDETILIMHIRLWMNEQIIFSLLFNPRGMLSDMLKKIHFGYNVKTRQLTKIECIPVDDHYRHEIWDQLHTNSLASFPSTT